MTGKRILLVEDHAAYKDQFENAFPGEVDIFHTVEDYLASGLTGHEYAFADFALAPGKKTGFSVLLHLQATSPDTRIVVFNEVADSGRILFNIAAIRWFNVWGMMTKGAAANRQALVNVSRGIVPTPEQWRRHIHRNGHLIDGLFEKPEWLDIWPVWRKYRGKADAILRDHPDIALNASRLRAFSERTSATVKHIEQSITTTLTSGEERSRRGARPTLLDRLALNDDEQNTRGTTQVATVAFAEKNYVFFDAPDLREAVLAASPWERR